MNTTNLTREMNECVSTECINNILKFTGQAKSQKSECVQWVRCAFHPAGCSPNRTTLAVYSFGYFESVLLFSSFINLVFNYTQCDGKFFCHSFYRRRTRSIHSSPVLSIYLAAPPAPPASGLVTPETSTKMATGTMYIQYLAKNPRLSLTSPRSRASRSRSIF